MVLNTPRARAATKQVHTKSSAVPDAKNSFSAYEAVFRSIWHSETRHHMPGNCKLSRQKSEKQMLTRWDCSFASWKPPLPENSWPATKIELKKTSSPDQTATIFFIHGTSPPPFFHVKTSKEVRAENARDYLPKLSLSSGFKALFPGEKNKWPWIYHACHLGFFGFTWKTWPFFEATRLLVLVV